MARKEDGSGGSRRSFIKKGALMSGGLSLGGGSTDLVGAQTAATEDDDTTGESETRTGLMFNHEYHPGAQFRVTSPAIDATPDLNGGGDDGDGNGQDAVPGTHDLRVVEYANTNEAVQLFVPRDADVEEGEVYELSRLFSVFEESPDEGLVSVEFAPVADEEVLFDDEDPGREPGQDFELADGGGDALITGYRFYSGALFRVDSGVIEWIPRQNVRRAVGSTAYNTRLAEYLQTSMNFVFYPADEAEVEAGAVYVMHPDAKMVDPTGRLHAVEFSRVDEDTLDDDLLAP